MANHVTDLHDAVITKWPFSEKASKLEASVIRETLKLSSKPGIINFAGGLPAPELFPETELKACTMSAMEKHGPKMLQYGLTAGVQVLRELIAHRMSQHIKLEYSPEIIQITSGSQQGLDLIARAFIDEGDYVLTERPTYLGALQAFNFFRVRYCTAELEPDGMNMREAEEQIKKYHPKFIYVVPNFQNPAGLTTSGEKRHALVDMARKYQIPIIDDNPYGELRYSGDPQPSLKELGGNAVIQLGTFSKIISPGLRIGWIAACPEVMSTIERVKQATDLHSNTFTQYIIAEYLQTGRLDSYHIPLLRKEYKIRRDIMLESMRKEFPSNVTFTTPEGGLFLWITLPEGVSASSILMKAIDAGVAFVPGKPFFPHNDVDRNLRVNFCNASHDGIRTGISRLAGVFREVV